MIEEQTVEQVKQPTKPLDVLFNEWLKANHATFTIVSVAPKTKAQVDLSEWLPTGWSVLIGFSTINKGD